MTAIAFISTALLTFVLGWIFGSWCGRQATLSELEEKK